MSSDPPKEAPREPTKEECAEMMNFPSEMDGDQWVKHFWSGEFLPWAMEMEPDKSIVKYFEEKAAQGRKNLNVFFPMCGSSPDMKWVAEQGHKVIGCEYAQKAGPMFAKNMKLTFEESDSAALDGKTFQYKACNIKMYCCDIFKFTSELEGKFDIIWDSAAFVAVNQKEKQKYADLIKTLLKPDGKLFINGIDYEEGVIPGPPFPFRDEHCAQFFSDFNAEYIDGYAEVEEYDDGPHTFTHGLRMLTLK